ncbi:beta-ketoacyl synthase N-terminal-like domain-containing protein [Pedobacter sp. NJ-S-72]
MNDHAISLSALSSQVTGVFIASSPDHPVDGDFPVKPYQITLSNALSFRLNLQGPSEQVNTFCTSVYVALHRAVQSIRSGEITHAIVGGINLIEDGVFKKAAMAGLYDDLLSPGNSTKSFCQHADGFVRTEGLGLFILKPLPLAVSDGNKILALVRGTAVHHGGSGFSIEAPNVKGMKFVMERCIQDFRNKCRYY